MLDSFLEAVRTGQSRSVVIQGPAGIGKSAMLEYTAGQAAGFRIERAVGIESELELAYAGLHQLCLPMLDRLDALPAPQREALSTAFGIVAQTPPDRFLVGLAVLSLLSTVAEERPLLVLVDDAQWLDQVSLQVLAFVARRIHADSVALIFAVRPGLYGALAGLDEIRIPNLHDSEAHALLDSILRFPMDDAVRARIVADSRGCPLALIELQSGMTPAQLAGGFGLPSTAPLMSHLEETYMARLEPLPSNARALLLAAALEPTGDVATLWRAAAELGIVAGSAEPAESSGLVEIGSRVRFKHPLVRSAVCRMADAPATRAVHRALAAVTDPGLHPDRRAWHRACAAEGPDESVAAELERSAGRAQERGGLAAAAAFLEAALRLTFDPMLRGVRALAAAQAKYQAGASDEALTLLNAAMTEPLDELSAARATLLRGHIAFFSSRGREAVPLLIAAAQQWLSIDPAVAREVYLDAIAAGLAVGRYADEIGIRDVAKAVHAVPMSTEQSTDLLLHGFATLITEGYAAGGPLLKRALSAIRADTLRGPEAIRWLWLATHAARDLWDDEHWELLSTRHIQVVRETGALADLPIALTARIGLHVAAGEIAAANLLVEETADVSAATGRTTPPYGEIALAAWLGEEARYSRLTLATMEATVLRGDGLGAAIVQYAGAVLYNSRGDYSRALATAEAGAAHPSDLCYSTWSQVELIEAASRSGEPARAAAALARLTESTQASGTDWALGIEARSRALVSQGDTAEGLYCDAIARLANTRIRMELARTHLLYGEWQRRAGRRLAARENLRTAHSMFAEFGAQALLERARRELLATGETVRKRSGEGQHDLTPQEAQIASLAADGLTNPEIGAELFISSRTVEWHLSKIYPKLGITSRRALRRTLATRTSRSMHS